VNEPHARVDKLLPEPISAALSKLPEGALRQEFSALFWQLTDALEREREIANSAPGAAQQAHDAATDEAPAAAKQNDLFRNWCEANPQLIWTADRTGSHDFYNNQWLKYTGKSLQENLNCGWLTAIHPEDRPLCAQTWEQRVKDKQIFEAEVRLRRADGQYRWHLARAVAICDEQGELEHWYGSYTEIEVQRRLMSELINARDQAQVASKLKSEFVANMSHELRTPMNGVLGMVEVLLRSDLSPKARKYSLMIREAGRSLLSIINDILDFSKIEAGKLELSSCDMDVSAIVEGVGEILSPDAEAKDLELITFIDPSIPTTLLGDPLRLRQVLVNLGGNAVKFTDRGTISFRAENISNELNCVRVRFSIADTGIGIPESLRKTLFEPFTQADGSIGRKYGGTGLGLSISKQLVDLMGGDLVLEDQVAGGTVFSFSVLFPAQSRMTKTEASISPGSNIMLVGVRPQTARCIRDYAEKYSVSVTILDTFEEAFKVLKLTTVAPTSIIVEATASNEDCFDFGRKVRASAGNGAVRLVYITNQARHVSFEQSLNKTFETCLTRPMRRQDVLDCLRQQSAREHRSTNTQEVDTVRFAKPAPPARICKENTVLVVDDNKMNQHVARLLLSDMGLYVEVVDNGIEAVSAIKKQHFDLIFLDCQMPELDGFEACQIIKQIQQRKGINTPVIAMTANAMTGSREECLAAGMDDYVCKPIDPNRLENMVNHWLAIKEKGLNGPPMALLLEEDEQETLPPAAAIDVAMLKSKFNDKVIRQLLSMFADSAGEEITKLDKALSIQAYADVAAKSHAFRGACGTICAVRLQHCCKQIELAAQGPDKQMVNHLFANFKEIMACTLREIEALLVSQQISQQ
jgi:PAS domain S-box-containing protein